MIDIGKNIALNTQSIIATAKKILLQCTDKRLKQILSSAIDKLPTISQQLKIMSTLRASRMKAMGGKVTKETDDANQMLVDCAENLMNVIVDVLKAAESASIKAKSVAKVDYSDV
ncbi:hypothetical protein MXB_364 [Myxobolus squamalis]|nr:hypothetical protein MXB_364 [Myxobolus squamalis]